MAKHTFKIGGNAADAEPGGGGFYDGDKPPSGVYEFEVKYMRLKTNKNNDDMLVVGAEIAESKGDKAQYNGYMTWTNLNVTDDSAGYINQLLDSLGINRKMFWPPNGPDVDNQDPPNVTKIGTKRPVGMKLRGSTKDDTYNGTTKLVISRFLPLKPGEDETPEPELELEPDVEEADGVEATSDESEPAITAEELEEYDIDDLKAVCDEWGIAYTARANEKTLRKKIMEFQESAVEEAAEEPEPEPEDQTEDGDEPTYTEEELKGYEVDDLKSILTDQFEVALPKPPIKPKLVKAILAAQEAASGEAPF